MIRENPTTAAYLTGETGVFTLLALIILAWLLVKRPAARKEDQLSRDATGSQGKQLGPLPKIG
jgi:hypothetical protein